MLKQLGGVLFGPKRIVKIDTSRSKSIDFNGAKSIDWSIWFSVPGASWGAYFLLLQFVTMKACTEVNFGVQMSLLTRYSHKYVPCKIRQPLIFRLYCQESHKLTIVFMPPVCLMKIINLSWSSSINFDEWIDFSHTHPCLNQLIFSLWTKQQNTVHHV